MLTERAPRSPLFSYTDRGRLDAGQAGTRDPWVAWVWVLVMLTVLGVSVLIVLLTNMRPGYDAFGWLVWGHQALHWSLNTDGAPSWKPLTFVFTLPYALAGTGQLWLWMVTAVAGAGAGVVFAARIAYMLTGPCPERRYAPFVAGAFAGAALLGLDTYSHEILIANSDPMIVTLGLAAIDCHLCRRPRLAFTILVLASLSRPEVWLFTVLYALWAWRFVPSMRVLAVAGVALIPAAWFIVPAFTSKDWFISGDLALRSVNAVNVIHGSKIVGVLGRVRDLNGWPIQVAALAGIVIAIFRRDRTTLVLVAAGCLWVALEIAMALHGWSAASRYLFEPGALIVVIAGQAVGRVLAFSPTAWRDRPGLTAASAVASWLLVAALVVALVPTAHRRINDGRFQITAARFSGRQIVRLQSVVAKDGGAARIVACGQPVTNVGLQSKVAWATGLNVGNVGFRPGKSIASGKPIVFFKPHLGGWQVRPIHISASHAASCASLRRNSIY